ncbi:MAG: TetR/AcrR family transcriptional regulator [Rhizobiaceae bacterium]
MARKRNVDHETVVAAAVDLFWDRGYRGASTREIEERTGLTRFTLQTAYGGKEGFFLDTLDAYLDNAEANHFPKPESFDLEALANWFENLAAEPRIPDRQQNGCLAFNSISEFDRQDTEINKRIERYMACLEQRIEQILQKAVEKGEARRDVDPPQMARILVGLLLGLHVVIKARSDDAVPQLHAKSAADLIRSWKRA